MSKVTPVTLGHITNPGNMTILEISNGLDFYDQVKIHKTLKPGQVYNLCVGCGLKLTPTDPFEFPEKLYDFEKPFRDQVIKTLRSIGSNNNIGVLLEGSKGMGKSITAKQLAVESGLPIILLTNSIPKEYDLASFFSKIKQDYVLFVDEFEKLFMSENMNNDKDTFHTQGTFLSILDGISANAHKRLVIFTSNNEINDKFINRPSRIRYYKSYNHMPQEIYDAIVEDKLIDKNYKQDLEENLDYQNCSIDVLSTIIEEINLHDKPYSSFKEFFNHKDKNYTYMKHKLQSDGTWDYIEDVTSKKELGSNEEKISRALGYPTDLRILKFNDKALIYSCKQWEEDDKDEERTSHTSTFKLTKVSSSVIVSNKKELTL